MKVHVFQGVKFEGIWYQSGAHNLDKELALKLIEQGYASEIKGKK